MRRPEVVFTLFLPSDFSTRMLAMSSVGILIVQQSGAAPFA